MKKLSINKIVGKRIKTIRGFRTDQRIKHTEPYFILFDDEKTYISLESQDGYTYHDCDYSAKTIEVIQCKDRWNDIFQDKKFYPVATLDIS